MRFSVHWRVKEKLIRLQISYSLAVQKRIDFLLLICNRSGPNCLQEIGTKTLQGFSCIIFRLLDGNVRFLAIYFFAFWLILSNILHLSWAGGYLDTKMKNSLFKSSTAVHCDIMCRDNGRRRGTIAPPPPPKKKKIGAD